MSYSTIQQIQELRSSLPKIVRDVEFLRDEDLAALASGLRGLTRFADALESESAKRSSAQPYENFGELDEAPPMSQIEQLARLHEYETSR